jgi:TolB-like protein/Tfp pilus assembly protein PilF
VAGTGQKTEDHGSAPFSPEIVRAQLNRVLADPRFTRSERHSSFLRYSVERTLAGEGDKLKEYVIAVEVYGKSASYDPSVDSIVRVDAARLRSKLLDYYTTNGREDPVRFEFPKGSYAPLFTARTPAAPVPPNIPALEENTAEGAPVKLGPPAPRIKTNRNVAILAMALLAGVIDVIGWRLLESRTTSRSQALSSIAVLPFASFSLDSESEAFAAGLTEDVANALARAGEWRVVARTSTAPFQASPESVIAIGQQLHVGTILEGTVRQEGDRLRITAQLVNAADGYRVWAETYERESRQTLSVQAELSRLIATSVMAERSRRAADATVRSPAANEARQISVPFLTALDRRGVDHLTMRDPEGQGHRSIEDLMAAVHGFERAIAVDPGYTPAYGGLAQAYSLAADFDERLWEKAKQAAIRGLQVDEKLPEPHFALGYYLFLKEWDFVAAARELKRALELNPRDVTAARLYADCSALLGDAESGFAALRRVQRAVPNSPVIAIQTGIMLYNARRFREFEEHVRSVQQRHSDVALVHWLRGLALEQQGQYKQAAAAFEKSLELSPGDPRATPALWHTYGLLGRRSETLKFIETSRDKTIKGWSGPFGIALMYLGLGDKASSLGWLETAYDIREGALPYMKLDPRCDPLRSEPRFKALLHKLKL